MKELKNNIIENKKQIKTILDLIVQVCILNQKRKKVEEDTQVILNYWVAIDRVNNYAEMRDLLYDVVSDDVEQMSESLAFNADYNAIIFVNRCIARACEGMVIEKHQNHYVEMPLIAMELTEKLNQYSSFLNVIDENFRVEL